MARARSRRMDRKDRKMVALFEKSHARKRVKVRVFQEPGAPKDGYRDEGVDKVLKAARAPITDEPMSAAEIMKVILRG